jgi:hypothetical protein
LCVFAPLPAFANDGLDRTASARQLDKLLTRFPRHQRERHGSWCSAKSGGTDPLFADGNESSCSLRIEARLTGSQTPRPVLETLYLALWRRGFPSRTTKDDPGAFINDEKLASELAAIELDLQGRCKGLPTWRAGTAVGGKVVGEVVRSKTSSRRASGSGKRPRSTDGGRRRSQQRTPRRHHDDAGQRPSDSLTMNSKDQCAMINRAFGLDALTRCTRPA